MKKAVALVALVMGFSAQTAVWVNAETITFEAKLGQAASYTEAGVTFTAMFGLLEFSTTPNSTTGLLGQPRFDPEFEYPQIRASIAEGASFVAVDLGDFDGDDDLLVLRAYDQFNNVIGFRSLLITQDFTGMKTLSLRVSIARSRPGEAAQAR